MHFHFSLLPLIGTTSHSHPTTTTTHHLPHNFSLTFWFLRRRVVGPKTFQLKTTCDKSYNASTIIIYKSRVVDRSKLPVSTTLES